MMNYVWAGMIAAAYLFACFNGNLESVTQSALDGAKSAVEMTLSLLGMMCLWTGLLEIAKRSGLTEKISKLLQAPVRFLFPQISRDREAIHAIVMNMTANFLGLSNAATPLGLQAMAELDRANGKRKRASDAMCMFVVLNTASINLIPTTLITLRSVAGSNDPFGIIVPVWVCSLISVSVGVAAVKIFSAKEGRKY